MHVGWHWMYPRADSTGVVLRPWDFCFYSLCSVRTGKSVYQKFCQWIEWEKNRDGLNYRIIRLESGFSYIDTNKMVCYVAGMEEADESVAAHENMRDVSSKFCWHSNGLAVWSMVNWIAMRSWKRKSVFASRWGPRCQKWRPASGGYVLCVGVSF